MKKKSIKSVRVGLTHVILIVISLIVINCEASSQLLKSVKKVSGRSTSNSSNNNNNNHKNVTEIYSCSIFEHFCRPDQVCLPMNFNCDYVDDCSDGSDESECGRVSISQETCDDHTFFHCKHSQKCIPSSWVCDGVFDCGTIGDFDFLDSSDEAQNCNKTCESADEISCSNGKCLPISKFCDGHVDCPNDEVSCHLNQCKNLKCDYDCRKTPLGDKCFCPPGQVIENITKCAPMKSCRDDACDQLCKVENGEEICSCLPGFSLQNGKCVDAATSMKKLFMLNSRQLFEIELKNGSAKICANFTAAYDMEINYANNTLCVLERSEISCFNVSNFQTTWKLPHPDFFPLSENAPKLFISKFNIDWISNNFYLMDSENQIIFVCNSNMKKCRMILNSAGDFEVKFQDFVIDPIEGFLFLSKLNRSSRMGTEIVRYMMDGSEGLSLFKEKLFHPKDLTIDVVMKRIFFLDNSMDFIQESDYDGKNRKFLQKMPPMKLQQIQFYENIFYAIRKDFSLIQIDKSTRKIDTITTSESGKLLKIFAEQIQPKSNVCSTNINGSGKCDQICIPLHITEMKITIAKCLCSEGFELKDGKCVLRKAKKVLFYVQKSPQSLRAIDVENTEMKVIAPIVGLDTDTTYDVDIKNRRIYFASHPDPKTFQNGSHAIEYRSFDGEERGMLKGNFGPIHSMAYDWKGKNIFFTTGLPRAKIVVIRVDRKNSTSSIIRTLITKDIGGPSSIALNPENGTMYWASFANDYDIGGKIEMANMDGTSRSILAVKNSHHSEMIYWPVSLTYHKRHNKLYWLDVLSNTINSITLGENRIRQQFIISHSQSLAVSHDQFYWTDSFKNSILIADIQNNENLTRRNSLKLKDIMGLKVYEEEDTASHDDSENSMQLNCPGIYFQTPTSGVCLCGDGYSKNGLGNMCIKTSQPPTTMQVRMNCSDVEFSCKSLDECISRDFVCDGFNDCTDRSDEELAPSGPCSVVCSFKCDDSRCLERHQVCDGIFDCADKRDESEEECPMDGTSDEDYCDEFQCNNNNCVDFAQRCDGIDNCGDNSDEDDSCFSHYGNATDGKAFYDEEDDDDVDDIKYILEYNSKACKSPELYCEKDRKCLSMHQICDGKSDCSTGTDEGGKCGERICDTYTGCQFFCHNFPTGHGAVCYCPEHLVLDSDGKSCTSPQICDEFSCSHICETLNLKKTRCHCSFGYQLKNDNFTCESMDKKDPILMFSSRQILKGVKLNKKQHEVKNYYLKGQSIVAIDFYYDRITKDYNIYWSDILSDKIFTGIVSKDEIIHIRPIVESHLSQVESVAVDWIGKNLYWIDATLKHIEVTTKDGMHRTTLISEDVSKPRSLAIDSRFAYLFWSDWEEGNPRIERATLAGEDRKSIFNISSKSGGWANGITLDFIKKRIFYVDAKTKEIHTINYDGENFKRILRDTEYLPHPYAISIFENNLFWTDWRLTGVVRADKFTGNNIGLFLNSTSQLFDVKLLHSSRQPIDFNGEGKSTSISSPCDNAKCSHLCLLSTSSTFKCGCPHLMRLKSNSNETCENIKKVMLYVTKKYDKSDEIRVLDFDFPNSTATLTIYDDTKIFSPVMLHIHPIDMKIFWYDENLKLINSMKLATPITPTPENIETLLDSDIDLIQSFTIDWTSNLMFFVQPYLSRDGNQKYQLLSCNIRGEYLTLILDNLDEIKSLIVSAKRKKIYFVTATDNDDKSNARNFLIKETNYDGSELNTMFKEDEIIENLVLDYNTSNLYFIKNHRKIFALNLDTKYPPTLINTFYGDGKEIHDYYITNIDIFSNEIYFYENTTNTLRYCNKIVCNETLIFRKNLENMRQFRINQFNIISKEDDENDDEKYNNGKCFKSNQADEEGVGRVCEHLCLPKVNGGGGGGGDGDDFVCRCAMGYKVDEKSRSRSECVPAVDSIIYSHDHEMKSVSIVKDDDVKFPPLQHINTISFFDVDIRRDLIYVADNERGEIYRVKRDGSAREVILSPPEGFEHHQYEWFSGLAVDWIAQNLYFSDKSKGIIEVVALIGKFRHVLLSQINKPTHINVDPVHGIIFFIDGNNKILKHHLNATDAVSIVNRPGQNTANVINDFVLDIENEIIYACESKTNILWKIDYNGEKQREIRNSLISNWISIDVSDGRIFWLERGKDEIKSIRVDSLEQSLSSSSSEVDVINVNSHIRKLRIMSKKRQYGSNACAIKKGNCDEICLSSDGMNVNCLCSIGRLNDDKRTCRYYNNYLFFSSENQFEKQGLDHIIEHPKIENSTYLHHAVAMTYDFERQIIYYSDIKLNAIFSCNFNGNDFKLLVDQQVSVEGITWNSQDNELFWTTNRDAEIRSKQLNSPTSSTNVILKMNSEVDKLRAIAAEPCISMLYFSNWNKMTPTISRIFVTGYGKENIITSSILMPNALTLDLEGKMLFWADAKLDKLERSNYDGRNRVVLSQSTPKHPFALTVFKQFIYWSDWGLHAVLRTNKFSGNDATFVATDVAKPLGLFVAQPSMKNCTNNICTGLKSGCEDICLPKGENSFTCECTQGTLHQDGKRCISRARTSTCNKSLEFECKSGECVPYTLTCDGLSHCSDASDEAVIFCATRKCSPEHFFECRDGRCIDIDEKCNGQRDCKYGEDEEKCANFECKSDEFKCKDGTCITQAFRCDYKPDCLDASDEMDCENRTCSRTFLKSIEGIDVSRMIPCNRTSNCYLDSWACDGQNDCWDWSDEKNCQHIIATNGTCPPNHFRCLNDKCILIQFVCDGVDDCEDAKPLHKSTIDEVKELSSDEFECKCSGTQFTCKNTRTCIPMELVCDGKEDCPGENETDEYCDDVSISIISQAECLPSESSCLDGECIPKNFFCDGKFDCDDQSDETEVCIIESVEHMSACEVDQFTCNDKSCIKMSEICDLNPNCPDNSDENMTLCAHYPAYCKQNKEKFLCTHGGCINESLVCNGANDCGDFSDEHLCNINECEYTQCGENAQCKDLKIGMECICAEGFQIQKNNSLVCEDINECESHPCSQLCFNTLGSFYCGCIDGFIVEGHRCRADSKEHPKILFANKHYIKTVDLVGQTEILVHNLSNAVAIDFDWNRRFLYFSDVDIGKKQILRVRVGDEKMNEPEILHRDNLKNPDGIAFDWIAMNLYWCDKGQKTIEVSRDNGKFRKVLIKSKLDNPRGLALNPYQRYMYWTDWGALPHIGRAGMDGSNSEVILSGNLGWPNALTISFETNELFFGDAKEDFIAVCDLDGKNRKIVAHSRSTPSINHIFAIATWDEKVYFSDWESKSIEFCDKYSGKNCGTLTKLTSKAMDIKVYHPFRQHKLRTTNSTTIKKPTWEKKKDSKKKFDLLANIKDNPCSSANCSALCLLSPTPPFYQCQCPDYFYLDKDQKTCVSNCTAAQYHCKKSMRCIPFFWKCDGQPDCDSKEDEPRDCPVFNCLPGEFQCDNQKPGKNSTCLEPIQVCDGKRQCDDGKDEENCDIYGCFIDSQFQCEKSPNSSAFCIPSKDRCNGNIDCPTGNDEKDCPKKVCPVSKFQCESNDHCISNVWQCDGDADCPDGSDERNCEDRECSLNEFRCPSGRCIPFSWLCDNEKDCPDGSDEGEKASCDVLPKSNSCDPSYFKCTSGNCIPGRWKCDRVSDCEDNSDEENCPLIGCDKSDFRCSDGQCINSTLRCDGHFNCNDFSDEISCDSTGSEVQCYNKFFICDGIFDCVDGIDEKNCGCSDNEFKCGGNFEKCIPAEWMCDGYFDCPDLSDEHDSRCSTRGCAGNAVKCKNGKCIPEHFLCNGVDDCGDLSDERNCFKKNTETTNTKSSCSKFGICSQVCSEKRYKESNFHCKCVEGYHKIDHMKNATCHVNDTHFLTMTAFRSDLSFFPTLDEARKHNEISSHSLLKSNLPKVTSFDYLISNDSLTLFYLNSIPSNALEKVNLNVNEYRSFNYTKVNSTFLIEQSKKVVLKSLTVDWITSKIYFIEDELIKAMEIDGSKMRTIIDAGVKSWDIIVDPLETRQIFWSTTMREIHVASMDGSFRRIFLKKDIEFVYGFAIDSPAKRLYWCDIKRSTIEAINLDGTGRQLVSKFEIHDNIYNLPINPVKLDVFEDEIYFVMSDNQLYKMNKFGANNSTFALVKHVNNTIKASHIKIIHAVRQPMVKFNPCSDNPCDKSAICYLSSTDPLGRSCNCPDNNFIQKNGSYVECLPKDKNPSLCYKNCANGGKCKFQAERMVCECKSRFEGESCDKYICSGYCKNHGVCILPDDTISTSLTTSELKAKRTCICPKDWEGETCEIPTQKCNTTCLNGGSCHVSTNNEGVTKEMCICPTNFSGLRCQNCSSRQCFNGGTCTLNSDLYKCICPARFSGLNCEIDRCRDYCLNGGNCSVDETSDSLRCECPFKFKGDKCEIDNRCENCRDESKNCTIHCHNGGRCVKDEKESEVCICTGEWKGIACNMLTCFDGQCGKCREDTPIKSCLCDDGSTQTCLPPEESFLHHQDVVATEIPNENIKTLLVIMIAAFVSVVVFVLIFVTIFYIQRWQTRRFFNFSQLNENVEEITNPIFDLTSSGEDIVMPVTNVLSQGHFGNPLYETMYATNSRKGLLEKKSDDEDEFKSDLL